MAPRKILFFELNEVPFRVVDTYCQRHPRSNLARLLPRASQWETFTEDDVALSPWITWPTLHRGVTVADHGIHNFGQPLDEVDEKFPPIWQLVAGAGRRAGVFSSLHSYPLPEDLEAYDFFVPDPFAPEARCWPESVETFQRFNLAMSRASARNVDAGLAKKEAIDLLLKAPGLGLGPATGLKVAGQLLDERRDPAKRMRRRTFQTILSFDIFRKLLRDRQPDFVSVFTNHVASCMHRFWAAAYPDDYDEMGYQPAWIAQFADEIDWSMARFDDALGQVVAFVDRHPEYQLFVLSSMGQAATDALPFKTQLYITDLARFAEGIGLRPDEWSTRPAMLPEVNFVVVPDKVVGMRNLLSTFRIDDKPVSVTEEADGFFSVAVGHPDLHDKPQVAQLGDRDVAFGALGMEIVAAEFGTGTSCAYHVPEGIGLRYDPQDAAPDGSRKRLSTLEFAPYVLRNFGIEVPAYMKPLDVLV